ncbi:Hsp20 family protein [archaeon]|nr:Hsp20 family protein [archaeon]
MDKRNFMFYWEGDEKDVKNSKKSGFAIIRIPGFKKDEISVRIKDNTLSINAAKKSHSVRKGKNFYKEESSASSFSRSIHVPGLDTNNIEVGIEDGAVVLKRKKRAKKLEKHV